MRGVKVRLGGERDIAAVGQHDAVVLHGAQDHLRGRRIQVDREIRAQAQPRAVGHAAARTRGTAGMARGPDVILGARERRHAGVRQDETDRMAEVPAHHLGARIHLVGVEQQRRDREARGVGAGAVVAAVARRIHLVELPHRQALRLQAAGAAGIGAVGLIQRVALHDQQVAIVGGVGAAESGARFDGGIGRYRHQRADRLAIGRVVLATARVADDAARGRTDRGIDDTHAEVDLHPPVTEAAQAGERGNHARRLRMQGGLADVLIPHCLGREARRRIGRDPARGARRGQGGKREQDAAGASHRLTR